MKSQSRRHFVGSIVGGSIGIGALTFCSSNSEDKSGDAVSSKMPVINEVDICVLGGSCTGVFAAIRASRLGARVAIVEKQNALLGTKPQDY